MGIVTQITGPVERRTSALAERQPTPGCPMCGGDWLPRQRLKMPHGYRWFRRCLTCGHQWEGA